MHARIIGGIRSRWSNRRVRRWSTAAAVILLGGALAARPASAPAADPANEAQRLAVLQEVALSADRALAELQSSLEAARQPARQGAALVVAGDAPPGPPLLSAAQQLEGASGAADAAGIAERRLIGTIGAVRPALLDLVPNELPAASDLAGIAGQLRSAVDPAATFVARRHAAEETLSRMQAALAALAGDDMDAAQEQLAAAAEARQVLQEWERPPPTLELWLSTTGRLIDAAQAIAEATQAGDPAAAEAAADAYAAAAEDARRADVSLALSLSETGSGLTATPLRRLAGALAATAAARSGVASLLQGDG